MPSQNPHQSPITWKTLKLLTIVQSSALLATSNTSGFVPAISSGSQRHWLRSRLPTTTLSSMPSEYWEYLLTQKQMKQQPLWVVTPKWQLEHDSVYARKSLKTPMESILYKLYQDAQVIQDDKLNRQTLHEEHKSSEELASCDNGRVAFMQATRVNPSLFPEVLSLSASNSRSAKYLLWS